VNGLLLRARNVEQTQPSAGWAILHDEIRIFLFIDYAN